MWISLLLVNLRKKPPLHSIYLWSDQIKKLHSSQLLLINPFQKYAIFELQNNLLIHYARLEFISLSIQWFDLNRIWISPFISNKLEHSLSIWWKYFFSVLVIRGLLIDIPTNDYKGDYYYLSICLRILWLLICTCYDCMSRCFQVHICVLQLCPMN